MKIEFRNISKSYGQTSVIEGISLTIQTNELFFLLGPSGCGKTTLLRMLAGFITPDSGDIFLENLRINDLPPEQRQIPMVFQSYALWPHLNVFENVAYGLRLQKLSNDEIHRRTLESLDITRMTDYAKRSPSQLSGGQQQRVAISRALAVNPKVLLFDEPLSNLDAKLRIEMREELLEIHRKRPFTAVYVTHDQEEAMTMATRLAVLNKGKIHQIDSPQNIFTKPTTRFVAEFMGPVNWLTVQGKEKIKDRIVNINTTAGIFQVQILEQEELKNQRSLLGFRPSAAKLNISPSSSATKIKCSVLQSQYAGAFQKLVVQPLKIEPQDSDLKFQILEVNPHQQYKTGEHVEISIASEDLILLPENNED